MFLFSIVGFIALLAGALFLYQRRLMYYPRAYAPTWRAGIPADLREVVFETEDGRQTAFYLPPLEDAAAPPPRLWVFFHGNAGTALEWLDQQVLLRREEDCGILLVDYPGYGLCEGSPTRDGIIRNGTMALGALARDLGSAPDDFQPDLGLFGVSMGAAAACELAVRTRPRWVVLAAPFTSILDMGRMYGPFRHVAVDRFDNGARLDELAARAPRPEVHTFHGTADQVVPFDMGRELAARNPGLAQFHVIKGADHNLLWGSAEQAMRRVMDRLGETAD